MALAYPPVSGADRQASASGELIRGRTLSELAKAAGIDAAALEETVVRYNTAPASSPIPTSTRVKPPMAAPMGTRRPPIPNLGPLERVPFYAVKVHIGSLGTSPASPSTSTPGRSTPTGSPQGPLCGRNDAASFTGGHYIGAGITSGRH